MKKTFQFLGYKEISLDEPVKIESDDLQIILTEDGSDLTENGQIQKESEEGFHIDNFGDDAPIVVEEPPADGEFQYELSYPGRRPRCSVYS